MRAGAGLSQVSRAAARMITAISERKHGLKIGLRTSSIGRPNAIIVDNTGHRYAAERSVTEDPSRYFFYKKGTPFDIEKPVYPRIPSWLIFDETLRKRQPVVGLREPGYLGLGWGTDNSSAIENGWILSSSRVDTLALEIRKHSDNRGAMEPGRSEKLSPRTTTIVPKESKTNSEAIRQIWGLYGTFEGIERLGIIPERLLITHGDRDHIGAFDAVVDRYGVETWVPAETEVDLDNDPDHRYSDGDQIGRFEAVHVPGHEDDSYALVREDAEFAILGDTVVGADIRGLPQGYFVVHGEASTTDIRAAERNLTKLTSYDFEAGLVFHGSSVLEDASEKIEAYVDGPKKNR